MTPYVCVYVCILCLYRGPMYVSESYEAASYVKSHLLYVCILCQKKPFKTITCMPDDAVVKDLPMRELRAGEVLVQVCCGVHVRSCVIARGCLR